MRLPVCDPNEKVSTSCFQCGGKNVMQFYLEYTEVKRVDPDSSHKGRAVNSALFDTVRKRLNSSNANCQIK